MSADEAEGEEEEEDEDEEEEEKNRVPESERGKVGDKRLQCGNWSWSGVGVGGSALKTKEGRKERSLEPLKSAPR